MKRAWWLSAALRPHRYKGDTRQVFTWTKTTEEASDSGGEQMQCIQV